MTAGDKLGPYEILDLIGKGGEAAAAPPLTVVTNWQAASKKQGNSDRAREIFSAVSLENGTSGSSDSPLCGK